VQNVITAVKKVLNENTKQRLHLFLRGRAPRERNFSQLIQWLKLLDAYWIENVGVKNNQPSVVPDNRSDS